MTANARTIRWAMMGACGRMGRELITRAHRQNGWQLVGAVDDVASADIGRDADASFGVAAAGVNVTASLGDVISDCDLVIDFSTAAAVADTLEICRAAGVPLLVGTTGLDQRTHDAAQRAARDIAVLIAANTSVGVTLLAQLVRAAAAALPADFDIEVVEAHHRHKRDAPSGTALMLGRAAAEGRGSTLDELRARSRDGVGARRESEIGFASLRGGDIVGEHSVLFAGTGERLTFSHSATDRGLFAEGALAAGRWLVAQPASLYGMSDFVKLNQ